MALGPIVAGVGLLLLLRVGADADYVTEVLPGMLLFGLGLSATVAPLTATALNSVEERHVGVASGINNGVSRVAGLLAIAVLGALISGQFGSKIDTELEGAALSAGGREAVEDAKADPLPAPDTEGLPPAEAEPDRGRGDQRGRGGIPPRHRGGRRADDHRRRHRRLRDPEPAPAEEGGAPAAHRGRVRALPRII